MMGRWNDQFCMEKALEHARAALDRGEFPVGCVISDGEAILAHGARSGTADHSFNEIDHAEIAALRNLAKKMPELKKDAGKLTLYSTLEPCLMCLGAVLISGIGRIVYAYEDVMGGGTQCLQSYMPPLYRDRKPVIVPYVSRSESVALLKRFFQNPGNHYWPDSLLAIYTLNQKS